MGYVIINIITGRVHATRDTKAEALVEARTLNADRINRPFVVREA